MRIARLHVSTELLVNALHLPSETRILGDGLFGNEIHLTVEHPDFDDIPYRYPDPLPIVTPLLRKNDDGSIEFVSWR